MTRFSRLTANTSVSEDVATVQSIKMLILQSSAVEMTTDERWISPKLFLWSLGTNVARLLLFYQTAKCCQVQTHFFSEFSKVKSSQNEVNTGNHQSTYRSTRQPEKYISEQVVNCTDWHLICVKWVRSSFNSCLVSLSECMDRSSGHGWLWWHSWC